MNLKLNHLYVCLGEALLKIGFAKNTNDTIKYLALSIPKITADKNLPNYLYPECGQPVFQGVTGWSRRLTCWGISSTPDSGYEHDPFIAQGQRAKAPGSKSLFNH